MIQTLCLASKGTEASLARRYGPGGDELTVVPGKKPFLKLFPPLLEVAKPMAEAPPLKKRPTWKADTMVLPKAKVSGSTSVACLLSGLVKVSVLSRRRVTLAKAEMVNESANTRASVIAMRPRIGHLNREIRDVIVPP